LTWSDVDRMLTPKGDKNLDRFPAVIFIISNTVFIRILYKMTNYSHAQCDHVF